MILKPLLSVPLVAGVAATFRQEASAFVGFNHNRKILRYRPETRIFSAQDKDNVGAYKYFGSDHFDMQELRKIIAEQTNPYHEVFGYIWGRPKPSDVYVILFNPDTENEGVHTVEYPKGSGHNVILAFESKKECERFSKILKDQQFYEPTPQDMKLEFLEAYCKPLGVFVQVVPEGVEIRPPANSAETLGHNPDLRQQQHLLDYLFHMEDEYEIEEDGAVFSEDLAGSWD